MNSVPTEHSPWSGVFFSDSRRAADGRRRPRLCVLSNRALHSQTEKHRPFLTRQNLRPSGLVLECTPGSGVES